MTRTASPTARSPSRGMARIRARLLATATALGATGALSLWPGVAAAGDPIQANADLNVRVCPSTACPILGMLTYGTCMDAEDWTAAGDWARITYQGRVGYVAGRYVRAECRRHSFGGSAPVYVVPPPVVVQPAPVIIAPQPHWPYHHQDQHRPDRWRDHDGSRWEPGRP